MEKKERIIQLVTGKTGKGKSHLVKNFLIEGFVQKGIPVLIADSMAEYGGSKYGSGKVQVYPGFDSFFEYVKTAGGFPADVHIVQLKTDTDAKKLFAFSALCETKHCILVEEASKFMSPHSINEHLNRIVSFGRHYSISCIFTAQRFAQMHKIVTSQANYIFSFQQTEAADIKAIGNYLNNPDIVKGLEKRQFTAFGDIPESSQFENGSIYTLNSKNKIVKIR